MKIMKGDCQNLFFYIKYFVLTINFKIMKRLILIDGNSLMNRAFYALPPLMNKEGFYTNAIYGFTNMIYKIKEMYNPLYMAVAFDLKAPTFRHKAYADYKSNRKGMPQELKQQVEPLKEMLDELGVKRIELEGFEADDLIGTISNEFSKNLDEILILTGDKDSFQLIKENVKVLFTKKGISELDVYDLKKMQEIYDLTPKQFIDMKGLMGDKSDNIPGIAGIGEKTALKLLHEFSSIENIMQNLEFLKPSLKKKIEENIETMVLSKKLATIVLNIPLDLELENFKLKVQNDKKLISLFKKYQFNSLLKNIKFEEEQEIFLFEEQENNENFKKIDFEEFLKKAKKEELLFLKTIFKKELIVEEDVFLDMICLLKTGEYSFIKKEQLSFFKEILESNKIKKFGYKIKEDFLILKEYDIDLDGIYFDAAIAEYVIDPSSSSYEADSLSIKYISKSIPSKEDLLGKGKKKINFIDLEKEVLEKYLFDIASLVSKIYKMQQDLIKKSNMMNLFEKIEIPLIKVLAKMEKEGMKIDSKELILLKEEFSLKLSKLTENIFSYVKEPFNINSPKQLGEILFEELNLPIVKKTKTGYSTDASVLEKLEEEHPIIKNIIEYRQLVKLQSTYVEGLLNIINPRTNRIHSSFNQTITTTGRISSTDPNLQNIPVRMKEGRKIRKAFIPKEGYILLDADYSQIELRILAHMCEDEHMIEAFNSKEDIHKITASQVFEVSLEEVTSDMRNAAKAVNFGIIYGISDFGLSKNLNISVKKAKEYIKNYMKKYDHIQKYMDNIIDNATIDGYVTTLMGRRRYIPELKASNFIVRNLGKRLAMNTPIQGSAADIIKAAMIKVDQRLEKEKLKSKMILQVHDELIIETHLSEVEKVKEILIQEMKNAFNLKVDLDIDLHEGYSWYETK